MSDYVNKKNLFYYIHFLTNVCILYCRQIRRKQQYLLYINTSVDIVQMHYIILQ